MQQQRRVEGRQGKAVREKARWEEACGEGVVKA